MRIKEIFSFGFLSLLKRFNCHKWLYYQTSAGLRNGLFRYAAVLLLLPLLYSCSTHRISRFGEEVTDMFRSDPPPPQFTCSVTTFIDRDFYSFIESRTANGVHTRIGMVPFNVPKNFSPIAVPAIDGYGTAVAAKFREQFLKYSPGGIFEFFTAEQITFEESKRDFERTNDRMINLALGKGYNMLILGQLNPIVNSSELNFSVKIIDLGNQVTIWSGEAAVVATAKSKDVNETNQALFYFGERSAKAAECTVKTVFRK